MSEEAASGTSCGRAAPHSGGQLSAHQARALTSQIRATDGQKVWELIAEAYARGAWSALGYRTWRAYWSDELGRVVHPSPDESRDVVVGLHEAGLSSRAISVVTGLTRGVVAGTLAELEQPKETRDEPESGDVPQSRPDLATYPPCLSRSPDLPAPELLDSLAQGLKEMRIALERCEGDQLPDQIDPNQGERWIKELERSAARLRRLSHHLKERIRAY
ncbi:hypothetical protein [Actinomadura litoris]|uniref:hypothetical protein n=1 Tax=Actinomadura litoris TaxID=2678616 RepID=UPI001FA6E857|nr:hypothetical protein [Actinomadura litoris]